jgi:hypothetical protein
MNTMSEKRKTAAVPMRPQDLPVSALDLWPDIGRWPTPGDRKAFARSSRQRPDDRAAVMTGLQMFAESDSQPLLAWTGVWVGLLAVGSSQAIAVDWVRTLIVGGTFLCALVVLAKAATLTIGMNERRRLARAWLTTLS